MKARGLAVLLIVAICAGVGYWYLQSKDASSQASTEYTSKHGDSVTINTPKAGDRITSPLTVSGVVPGPWSFEANFPVEIVDADHKKVARPIRRVIKPPMIRSKCRSSSAQVNDH